MASRTHAPLSEAEVGVGVFLLLTGVLVLAGMLVYVARQCCNADRPDPRRARTAIAAPVQRGPTMHRIPPTPLYPLRVGRGGRFVLDGNRFI